MHECQTGLLQKFLSVSGRFLLQETMRKLYEKRNLLTVLWPDVMFVNVDNKSRCRVYIGVELDVEYHSVYSYATIYIQTLSKHKKVHFKQKKAMDYLTCYEYRTTTITSD
jgi:hypothetical protein